ncbi:MAG TPA: roadblock/LC7 domain-containing protein [Caldisericia bacterium]|jgi:predicted regulator of Ras-like GTPase activity (Roadblock/LC7/MglB family)|nr:roadblock/LC7 domain-containing protein [Caldisericia bacterium]HOC52631.1 roadblock/LC7 domain-containing protein [Caldisericia bacterium]HPB33256.1 roadblock/LC7 domain-containing protein [Caldisericia bacterium]HQL66962.1 roadblock/LC7 domain-containing protein [Caldisericia bacterium]HQN47925.1 roadblock/LC7 domain-containing protein [Caldisericia bacterium]
MEEILRKLKSIHGVIGVMIVESDGLLINSIVESNIDPEAISGLCASVFRNSRSILNTTNLGDLEIATLEADNGTLFIKRVEEVFLALLTRKEINLGLIRLTIKNASNELSNLL